MVQNLDSSVPVINLKHPLGSLSIVDTYPKLPLQGDVLRTHEGVVVQPSAVGREEGSQQVQRIIQPHEERHLFLLAATSVSSIKLQYIYISEK